MESTAVNPPTMVSSRRGTMEKDRIPSRASVSIFLNGYFVAPANRAQRLYGNGVYTKPAQRQSSHRPGRCRIQRGTVGRGIPRGIEETTPRG